MYCHNPLGSTLHIISHIPVRCNISVTHLFRNYYCSIDSCSNESSVRVGV